MTALPSWIDLEAWAGYVDMRKAMKKPMTSRAESLVLKTLYRLRELGHDANAALDQSTVHNWLDVYAPKEKEIPNLIREPKPREPERTPEQKAADKAAKDRVMATLAPLLRRVS